MSQNYSHYAWPAQRTLTGDSLVWNRQCFSMVYLWVDLLQFVMIGMLSQGLSNVRGQIDIQFHLRGGRQPRYYPNQFPNKKLVSVQLFNVVK